MQKYLTHLRLEGLSERTIYDRSRTLTRLAGALPVPLVEATPQMIYDWRAALAVGPDAVGNYVSAARVFYDWAIRHTGLITVNPAAAIPVPPISPRLPRPIPEAALMDIISWAPARVRPWLVLAGWAGFRAQEIAWLRCESVFLDAAPPAVLVARDTAKGRRERLIPLCDFAAAELAAQPLQKRGFAFTRRDGQAGPNTPDLISHLCNEHIHECGYTDTLHSLRHRFLTMVQRQGRDLRITQQLAGHRSPETTAVYTLVSGIAAAAAVQALPAPPRLRAAG
jgi:integrase/recombinase XerC